MPENRVPALPEGASTPPLLGRKILLAVAATDRLQRILQGHELTVPANLDEAKVELQKREFDMVVLGVHFDESRMFELLRLVRTYPANQLTPVVCMLTAPSRLSDVAIEGIDHAVKAMLANAFLNLNRFPDNEAGNGRVRRIIDYLILIDGDMHGGLEAVHGKN
jgi:CheY-like chemotaxis protein